MPLKVSRASGDTMLGIMVSFKSGVVIPEHVTIRHALLLGDLVNNSYKALGIQLPILAFLHPGGTEMSRAMIYHLDILPADTFNIVADRIEQPEDSDQPSRFRIGQFPTEEEARGKHIVVVDAVCRSGDKLAFVTNGLAALGALSVRSAVIYDMARNMGNPRPDQYRADYSLSDGQALGNTIFHWEWNERVAEIEFRK